MECLDCTINPSFYCHCANVFLCNIHIVQHLNPKDKHNFENIELESENEEILNRISTLKAFRKEIIKNVANLIKFTQEMTKSIILELNSIINQYYKLIRIKRINYECIQEIKLLKNSEMTIVPIFFKPIEEVIKKNLILDIKRVKSNDKKTRFYNFLNNHMECVKCISITNDGTTIITGSNDFCVRLWDVKNKFQISCFANHLSYINCLAVSKDDSFCISGSNDRTVHSWNLEKKCLEFIYRDYSGPVILVAISADSQFIISGINSREIIIKKTNNDNIIRKIIINEDIGSFLISNQNLICLSMGKYLEIWDLKYFGTIYSIKAHEKNINSISLTKNNIYIITCSDDKLLRIWMFNTGQLYTTLTGHNDKIITSCVTPDDKSIISSSSDKVIRVWCINSGKVMHIFKFFDSIAIGIVASENFLFSVLKNKSKIGIINLESNSFDSFITLHQFSRLSVSMNNKFICFGSSNDVVIHDLEEDNYFTVLKSHVSDVNATCISSNSKYLLSSSEGQSNNLIFWNLSMGGISKILSGNFYIVLCVDISDDEKLGASAGREIILWNLENQTQIFVLNGLKDEVNSVKFTRNANYLATGGNDCILRVWDVKNKQLLAILEGNQTISKIFYTNNHYFVSANFDGNLSVWNIYEMKQEFNFTNLSESKNWIESNNELEYELGYLF